MISKASIMKGNFEHILCFIDETNLSTLSKIDQITDSKKFLEECTYFIGLTGKNLHINAKYSILGLYKVHSTCHYNEGMVYCPV